MCSTSKYYHSMSESNRLDEFYGDLYHEIMEMFSCPEESIKLRERMLRETNIMSRAYLNTNQISSPTCISELVNEFMCRRIPSKPVDFFEYLKDFSRKVLPNLINTASPRFIGHMTSALPSFIGAVAKLIVDLNQNVVKVETSKALTLYEREAIAMLHRLIYQYGEHFYNEHMQNRNSALGSITSGGTSANITALWCARNLALPANGEFKGVDKAGIGAGIKYYGYNGAVIIGSALMHYSFDKAADILGIGSDNLIKVPVDQENRIDMEKLGETIDKCKRERKCILAVIGIAGSTNSGSIDPIDQIAEIVSENNIYFHVDAAWGGPLLFSGKHKHLLSSIDRADSITIDGHKQLYLPIGIGMVFFKNPGSIRAIRKNAEYIIREKSFDLGQYSIEGSRPGNSILLHTAMNVISMSGYEFLINEGIRKTQYMVGAISARPEFEMLFVPQINILNYRYIPEFFRGKLREGTLSCGENAEINRFNEKLQKTQRKNGNSFVSRTTLYTKKYGSSCPIVSFRAVIANPLTSENDIDYILNDQVDIARKLTC